MILMAPFRSAKTFYRRGWGGWWVFPQEDSVDLLGQGRKCNFFGIAYLVGKNKVQTVYFRVHWLGELKLMFFSLKPLRQHSKREVDTGGLNLWIV